MNPKFKSRLVCAFVFLFFLFAIVMVFSCYKLVIKIITESPIIFQFVVTIGYFLCLFDTCNSIECFIVYLFIKIKMIILLLLE